VQGRAKIVVRGIDVGAARQHHAHNVEGALPCQLAQLPTRLHLVVAQAAALAAQQLGHLPVPFAHRVPQRRASPSVLEIQVGASANEQLDDTLVAHAGGQVETSAPIIVRRVHRAAAVEQHLEQLEAAALGMLAQLPTRLHLIVAQVAALAAQQLGHLPVPFAHRVPQRRASPSVLEVDVAPLFEQQRYDGRVPLGSGEVEGRPPVVVGGVDVCAAGDERLELLEASKPRELAELGRGACLRKSAKS